MEGELEAGALRTEDGSWTLHRDSDGGGEACHSRHGARTEARRHAEVVLGAFERRAAGSSPPPVLRILDVGLGPGLNSTAVWERAEGLGLTLAAGSSGRLVLSGLEIDPDLVRRSLALPDDPDAEFARRHAALRHGLRAALAVGAGAPWRGEIAPGVELEVLFGDARATLARAQAGEAFDGILLDPFSPASDESLWTPEFLGALAARLAPGGRIATYSAATRVRAALAAAGLEVGPTPRLGAKAEGTVAVRGPAAAEFEPRTARRVARRALELRAELERGAALAFPPVSEDAGSGAPSADAPD
ncbi:tRNA 5-methylaminomethyl-2-thiouridine biosynthesis bifunctional protein MnmC [Planctomycetes bacterium Pla163]|uniref:tRNA 5-methylaminomethyl-2-thiouridine biosynthesis bifunctional protein MnmC n=1 Tax=Rohdeia mirabilis TaxID=2528008 RepID=A0A518CZV3_9BACT|nr:tRNA 5-methylaminomethyl-2-thiouridine biosynthesis bifunctional protein MnmC [Planctomycetes bacterium Pla163]